MDDDGAPISYLVLAEGTPVRTRDGDEVGLVIAVRAADREDIFDGITVATPDGERFVDADHVEEIRERVVRLRLDARQAARLPEPEPALPPRGSPPGTSPTTPWATGCGERGPRLGPAHRPLTRPDGHPGAAGRANPQPSRRRNASGKHR